MKTVDWVRVMKILLLLCMNFLSVFGQHPWERPGCHILGYHKTVKINGCSAFRVKVNACRGYCTSYAIPSSAAVLRSNPRHVVTSRADCCSITDTHDVRVKVWCGEDEGYRYLTFKSAAECQCSVCKQQT